MLPDCRLSPVSVPLPTFPPSPGQLLVWLDSREREELAQSTLEFLPIPDVDILIPAQDAHPRLNVIVQPKLDILCLSNLAIRVRNLVLGLLVLQPQYAPI